MQHRVHNNWLNRLNSTRMYNTNIREKYINAQDHLLLLMEKIRVARDKAVKNIQFADHLLTQTYPTVKDPKLLLAVLENIFLALTNSLAAALHHERYEGKIPPFQDTFDSKFNTFKLRVAQGHNITNEELHFILEIKNLVVAHKQSPVEFAKKDAFVICSDKYKLNTIYYDQMKKFLSQSKQLVHKMNQVTLSVTK